MKRALKNLLTYFRYRRLKFKAVGTGAVFKSIQSNFVAPENIEIGNDVHIGPGANFDAAGGIRLGEGTIIAPNVTIFTRTHNFRDNLQAVPFDNVMWTAPVIVEKYTWIGANAIILPGVTIGEGAVIGAGSVVSRDVPPCNIYAGNPAKQIGTRSVADFMRLADNPENFCYRKHGHRKVFRTKPQLKPSWASQE